LQTHSPKILVTGANGFVGSHLLRALHQQSYSTIGVTRNAGSDSTQGNIQFVDYAAILSPQKNPDHWEEVDCIVHLAARVHVMQETASNPLDAFREVNIELTRKLALEAIRQGVRRFIFISSIKVNGESTRGDPCQAGDIVHPDDPYAISKYEAEQVLIELCRSNDMEFVIVRPPLVYGPGVGGNFASLVKVARSGLPLPLKAIRNRRAMISVHNLVDLIIRCIESSEAANQLFLARDETHYSTADVIRAIRKSYGQAERLFYCPERLLHLALLATGKKNMAIRLLGSLEIDDEHTLRTLNWQAPCSMEKTLASMV